jgi:hypothetical protein
MDSITIAEMAGTGFLKARANRTQDWLRTPCMNSGIDYYTMAIDRQKTLSEDEKKAKKHLFYDFLPQ